MIKKALTVGLILFITYSVFLLWLAPVGWRASQHQWQQNAIKAQEFIYSEGGFESVIVGSSLSCRLFADSLKGSYNLSFQGQGVFDGLRLIPYKQPVPKYVLIEMNVVMREENVDFTNSLTSPILFSLRKYIPALQQGCQPIAVAGKYISKSISQVQSKRDGNLHSAALFDEMLSIHAEDYRSVPELLDFERTFAALKHHVSKLEAGGSTIIFFEMPVDERLHHLPRPNSIRNYFYRNFPANKYKYIIPDRWNFVTTDGIHLRADEAQRFTNYLKQKIYEFPI
jgi:hypothetical protein